VLYAQVLRSKDKLEEQLERVQLLFGSTSSVDGMTTFSLASARTPSGVLAHRDDAPFGSTPDAWNKTTAEPAKTAYPEATASELFTGSTRAPWRSSRRQHERITIHVAKDGRASPIGVLKFIDEHLVARVLGRSCLRRLRETLPGMGLRFARRALQG